MSQPFDNRDYDVQKLAAKDAEIERLKVAFGKAMIERTRDAKLISELADALEPFALSKRCPEGNQLIQRAREVSQCLRDSQFKIGEFTLSLNPVPEGEKPPFTEVQHVFIRHQSGEMMSVRESEFAELIDKFYKEHF